MPTPTPAGSAVSLGDDEVHLWLLHLDDVDDRALGACEKLLDAEERRRRDRFLFERDRRTYSLSHGLVRSVLSAYAEVPPQDWVFEANAYGRPEIAGPAFARELRFNLSHTRGAGLVGVARRRAIGVDVEAVDRQASCVELADRYFSPAETADLMRLPAAEQRDAFFNYWTLKEAYIKARGMGLAIPLDRFSFRLSAAEPIRLNWEAAEGDDPLADDGAAWHFVQASPDRRFRLAAAARSAAQDPLRFSLRKVVTPVDLQASVELL